MAVITLPKVEKIEGGSPLLVNGKLTLDVDSVRSVERMHHSWWWTGWEDLVSRAPVVAKNQSYYLERYPTALGGEHCCIVTFKDGGSVLVKGGHDEVSKAIFGLQPERRGLIIALDEEVQSLHKRLAEAQCYVAGLKRELALRA